MIVNQALTTIETHTLGEPTRILTSPLLRIAGNTMIEKKENLQKNYDYLRTILMKEPRGHRDMFGAILTEPSNLKADIGVVYMNCSGYLDMCIHGTIGVVTAILETGILAPSPGEQTVFLDTPAGLVKAEAFVEHTSVKKVEVENVPSFLYLSDLEIDNPDFKKLKINISFGGNFFAFVEAEALGETLRKENLPALIQKACAIKEIVNQTVPVEHPTIPNINRVELVGIYSTFGQLHEMNVTVFGNAQFDRSPCGTGTCARMAMHFGKGHLGLNHEFINESIIGTQFRGVLIGTAKLGKYLAVVPRIKGRAYVIGLNSWMVDPDDPLKEGFLVI